jgi:hypothetical protein
MTMMATQSNLPPPRKDTEAADVTRVLRALRPEVAGEPLPRLDLMRLLAVTRLPIHRLRAALATLTEVDAVRTAGTGKETTYIRNRQMLGGE